jgi:hypothetical protein
MAATVTIDESNGVSETVTAGITNCNMGTADTVNMDPTVYPITAGQNSCEKVQRFHLTALGGSTRIQNLQVWRTGALAGSDTHVTNARTTSYVATTSYTQGSTTTSTKATQTMPTAAPGTANLGIGGALAGTLTAAGYSDYLYHQIKTDSGTTAGVTVTMNYQYDEVA